MFLNIHAKVEVFRKGELHTPFRWHFVLEGLALVHRLAAYAAVQPCMFFFAPKSCRGVSANLETMPLIQMLLSWQWHFMEGAKPT